jgi:hypothetical protein
MSYSLDDILDKVGNLHNGFNLYLVSKGAREATLIESTNYKNTVRFDKVVEYIMTGLPNTKSAWDPNALTEFPRLLVFHKSVPIDKVENTLNDTSQEKLGELLGYRCLGEMGGQYSMNIIGKFNGIKFDVTSEVCSTKPKMEDYQEILSRYQAVSPPNMELYLSIQDAGFVLGQFAMFLKKSTIAKKLRFKEEILNMLANFDAGQKSVFYKKLDKITRKQEMQHFWEKYGNAMLSYAVIIDHWEIIGSEEIDNFLQLSEKEFVKIFR